MTSERGEAFLRPGDIVLTTADSFVSRAIRYFTRLPGEPQTRFSHAEIVVGRGRLEVAEVVSADARGIRQRTLLPFHGGKAAVIYRPPIPAEERRAAASRARRLVGGRYPYWRLAAHMMDRLLAGAYLCRRAFRSPDNPECAALIALVYDRSIIFSNKPWWAVDPDDLDDHAQVVGYAKVFEGVLP